MSIDFECWLLKCLNMKSFTEPFAWLYNLDTWGLRTNYSYYGSFSWMGDSLKSSQWDDPSHQLTVVGYNHSFVCTNWIAWFRGCNCMAPLMLGLTYSCSFLSIDYFTSFVPLLVQEKRHQIISINHHILPYWWLAYKKKRGKKRHN